MEDERVVPGAAAPGRLIPPLLDTSIIVRYLTDDPPVMAARATAIIESDAQVGVSAVVLAETAFVLGAVYGVAREMIVDGLVDLVARENITVLGMERQLAVTALRLCRPSRRVSFPDALLWAEARTSGAGAVYSFDEQFPTEGITILRDAHQTP